MQGYLRYYSIVLRVASPAALSKVPDSSLLSCSHMHWAIGSNALRSSQHVGTSVRTLTTLQETLAAQVPAKQQALLKLKKEHGSTVIGEVTIDQCIGGARGVKCMLWETSNLDSLEGIRFRGLTIPDCQK
eukprot:scaffold377318_cov24-Attheya_sp.AAC.1